MKPHIWRMGRLLQLLILALILLICIYLLFVCQFNQCLLNVSPSNHLKYNHTSFTSCSGINGTFTPTNDSLISKEEWESLLKELQWSLPPVVLLSTDEATNPTKCSFSVVNPNSNHTIGGFIDVILIARDTKNRIKTYGGDFFQAKLFNSELKASTYGAVTDHFNGTYTARLALLWPGPAKVSIRLVHSSEAVQVLCRQREQDPDKVYFQGYFEEGGKQETVMCNAQRSPRLVGNDAQCCCEYREPVTGETWFCRRPSSLPCHALTYHSMGGYQAVLSKVEMTLLKSSMNIIVPGDDSAIDVQQQDTEIRSQTKCRPGFHTSVPAGFYFQDHWTSLVCDSKSFPSAKLISGCLKDKQILMMGDSTLRQWFDYLEETVPTLKRLNLHTSSKSGPFEAVDTQSNTRIIWRAHGIPIRTSKTPWADLHYIASEVEGMAGGAHSVVVFTIWAHFTTYPLAMYAHRLVVIRRAVASLLRRSPTTLVVIKSANTGYKDVYGSDWLSWQLDMALREIFRDLPVVLIDVWQMTSCHYSPDNIHPPSVVIQNEVDLFLSFVCPQ
ncbi:NXPE family member 3-like isoform X1 [Oncorhynchus tshawytscha]|uniref:NXPE C-terminal domain-containing protein n=1 Tax=Oncorhynchus tshawytscha TaxID=74940 RepID=A0A8C8CTD1_ONCTS|nr:NXPE family member 3-like isoform X1 [Oncorhynchus tshawytscha]